MKESDLLPNIMQRCQQRINPLLTRYLPVVTENNDMATHAMHYACLNGGKRLRPLLAYLIADFFEQNWQCVDPLAAAIEMIHCYSLIHDDLPAMDNDDLRRGLPTCHKRYGEATAILAGDALLTLAFEILSHEESFASSKLQCKIIHRIAQLAGTQGMVKGQMLDLSESQKHFNINQLIEMHHAKTGALIKAVVQCAAWVCGANHDEQAQLSLFAQKMGLAFQVQDDLLDVTSDVQTMGKNTGQDAKNETCTFITLLGEKGTEDFAKQQIAEAIQHLKPFGQQANHLIALANFVVTRKN